MSVTRPLGFVAAGLFALTTAHGAAQDPRKKDNPPSLPNEAQVMQLKLKHSQALLGALATEDYKQLEEHATALARITKATEFLRAYKTEEYEFQMRAFQRSAETLAEKAKAKNLDGATLAYMNMTSSCVGCHNHFRGKKRMD